MNKISFILLLLSSSIFCVAQTEKKFDLHLSTGTVTLAPNFSRSNLLQPEKGEIFEGYYYRYIQFADLPSAEQRQSLSTSGLKILMYLPENTFIAAIKKGTDLHSLSSP